MASESRRRVDELDAYVRASPRDVQARSDLDAALDSLVRHDLGLVWRYVPGGAFEMGSERGELDERPVHRVHLGGFWMSAVPLSWSDHCRVAGYQPPPIGRPSDEAAVERKALLGLYNDNKARLQYCEDHTTRALDWHAHDPSAIPSWRSGPEGTPLRTPQDLFGRPPRDPADAPYSYEHKPSVHVSFAEACTLAARMTESGGVRIELPSEAQWERAARGLRVGARFPWGDDAEPGRCDCEAFEALRIRRSRALPPNDYGLYAMSGGVWEWCRDAYDALYYRTSPEREPLCTSAGEERVLRGGSWADSVEACTTSFRMSRKGWGAITIGCRFVLVPDGDH